MEIESWRNDMESLERSVRLDDEVRFRAPCADRVMFPVDRLEASSMEWATPITSAFAEKKRHTQCQSGVVWVVHRMEMKSSTGGGTPPVCWPNSPATSTLGEDREIFVDPDMTMEDEVAFNVPRESSTIYKQIPHI